MTSAAICRDMSSKKITPFTQKLGPAAETNDWECHSTTFSKGPNLTNSLVEILLRFRLHRIALTADIEKDFLQLKVKEEYRRYFRRFYNLRNPKTNKGTGQLAVYHFNVNIFGSRASYFILAAVLQRHLQKYNLEHTALDIGRNILLDNLVTGTDTEEEAKTYFRRTRKLQ